MLSLDKMLGLVGFVVLVGTGQILFKLASRNIAVKGLSVLGLLQNGYLVIALILYGFCTLYWVWLLKDADLSKAYPFMSLTFVVVPVMSYFFLGEKIGVNNLLSSLLIVAGVIVASR